MMALPQAAITIASCSLAEGKHDYKYLVIVVPAVPKSPDTISELERAADKLIILFSSKIFHAIGQFETFLKLAMKM